MDRYERQAKRQLLKEKAVAHLGGCCSICKYDKCIEALQFHHLNEQDKDFSISNKMTSWKSIEKELKKCVLLCCRCHVEVHNGMHPSYLDLESYD